MQFYDEGCEIKLHDDGRQENRLCVFLYFLNDNSEDYYKTREFIRSRIANVLALGKWKKSGLDFLKKFR